jgi:hypothetical protein
VNLADYHLVDDEYHAAKAWNNAASSMMLVHTAQGPEVRLRATTTLTPTWNTFIDGQLTASSGGAATVARKGNPKWRWVPFPIGIEHLSPKRIFLRVHQRLHITLENWPDLRR